MGVNSVMRLSRKGYCCLKTSVFIFCTSFAGTWLSKDKKMRKFIVFAAVIFSASRVLAVDNSAGILNTGPTAREEIKYTESILIRPLETVLPFHSFDLPAVNFTRNLPPIKTDLDFANRYKSLFWYEGRTIYA